MSKRPPPPPLSYVLRTPTLRTEYKGAHVECHELLFVALPDALARRKMIDRLEKTHARMLARESGPDVDQATAAQVASLAHQVHPSMALPSLPPAEPPKRCSCPPGTSVSVSQRCETCGGWL